MDCTKEKIQQVIREIISDKLSHNPYSQEYVDKLVEKAFMDLSAAC